MMWLRMRILAYLWVPTAPLCCCVSHYMDSLAKWHHIHQVWQHPLQLGPRIGAMRWWTIVCNQGPLTSQCSELQAIHLVQQAILVCQPYRNTWQSALASMFYHNQWVQQQLWDLNVAKCMLRLLLINTSCAYTRELDPLHPWKWPSCLQTELD